MEELKLSQPFESLSGEHIDTLHFDFSTLKTADYRLITRLESRLKGISEIDLAVLTKKTSSEFRMASAWVAALRGTKGLGYDDIDKISLSDLLDLEEIGAFFTVKLV